MFKNVYNPHHRIFVIEKKSNSSLYAVYEDSIKNCQVLNIFNFFNMKSISKIIKMWVKIRLPCCVPHFKGK